MRRLVTRLGVLLGAAGSAHAQSAGDPLDLSPYQHRAAQFFDPQLVAGAGSALSTGAENLLVLSQAVAAVLVVAGLIGRMRRDQVQMEGIASMMLKVAFIAMVPLLRVQVLDTVDAAASALGYETAATAGTPPPMTAELWNLFGQWTPPGSPALDALETQAGELPGSGDEPEWALSAWNWAKGVGTTTSNQFDAGWQAVSGGMRAGAVFAGCGTMACLTSLTLILTYLSEVLRYLLFFVGCAVLPVFIAALGVDSLRGPALRFIVFLVSIACWPVGWALAHGVTALMAHGLLTWIGSISTAALSIPAGDPVPPLAVAAPFVGWGGLFLFMGATTAICVWVAATALYAPLAIGRLISAGANAVAAAAGAGEWHRDVYERLGGGAPGPMRVRARSQSPRNSSPPPGAGARFIGAPGIRSVSVAALRSTVLSMHEASSPPLPMARSRAIPPASAPAQGSAPMLTSAEPAAGSRTAPWLVSPPRRAVS